MGETAFSTELEAEKCFDEEEEEEEEGEEEVGGNDKGEGEKTALASTLMGMWTSERRIMVRCHVFPFSILIGI